MVAKTKKVPKDINSYLTARYYNASKPGSYSSIHKLYKSIQHEGIYDISLDQIKQWAMSQEVVTLYQRPTFKNRVRRKVVSGLRWSLMDCDLLVLNQERYTAANEGRGYILVCIDILSRYAAVASVKTKSGPDVLSGFKEIFNRIGKFPVSVRADFGKEFNNAHVTNYMRKHGVNLYYARSSTKANYSESFIRNLKSRLFRVFQHRNTYRYLDILQKLVESYNSTFHSSIEMAPSEVNSQNEQEVWFRKYFPPASYKEAFIKANRLQRSRKSSKIHDKHLFRYKIGDHVRISTLGDKFTRDFDTKFSGEVYTVTGRAISQGIPIYYLSDQHKKKIEGSFYEFEMQGIYFNPKQTFKIEKVLQTRTRKGVKESLVKYQFWPASYNQWLPTKSIKQLI
jgi:ribosomal protein L21E